MDLLFSYIKIIFYRCSKAKYFRKVAGVIVFQPPDAGVPMTSAYDQWLEMMLAFLPGIKDTHTLG